MRDGANLEEEVLLVIRAALETEVVLRRPQFLFGRVLAQQRDGVFVLEGVGVPLSLSLLLFLLLLLVGHQTLLVQFNLQQERLQSAGFLLAQTFPRLPPHLLQQVHSHAPRDRSRRGQLVLERESPSKCLEKIATAPGYFILRTN
jgi:hypothetical protein